MTLAARMAKVAAALVAVMTAACGAVPYLTYAQVDGSADALAADAAKGDGHDATDAAIEAGCPGPNPPPGASVCCGSVPCNGDCATHCADCETECTAPGTFCCAKTNNVLCRPTGAVCN